MKYVGSVAKFPERRQTNHPERIIPAEAPLGIVALHLKRYQFARKYIRGKRVLDMACGVGYGSLHLAEACMHVVGADADGGAINYAKQHYGASENIAFIHTDAMRSGLATSRFEVVCSFETIEHVLDVDLYLSEVKRVLAPGGLFIVSTPRVSVSDSRPQNPHHYREWSPADFNRLLSGYFKNVELYGQLRRETSASRWLKRLDVLRMRTWLLPLWLTRRAAQVSGVRAMVDLQLEDVFISRGDLNRASEIVAVASDENEQH